MGYEHPRMIWEVMIKRITPRYLTGASEFYYLVFIINFKIFTVRETTQTRLHTPLEMTVPIR